MEGGKMKKQILTLAVVLTFLSALGLSNAQTSRGPQLGSYGNLVGLNAENGQEILKQVTRPWREGYAIAYRVKNSKGNDEDRFVYVIGDQISRNKLTIDSQKSTNNINVIRTLDGVLEISRSFTYDVKSNTLSLEMSIRNIGKEPTRISASEILIDSRIIPTLDPEKSKILCELIRTPSKCSDCPPCPCAPRCQRGQVEAFYRSGQNPGNDVLAKLTGNVLETLQLKEGAMLSLFWRPNPGNEESYFTLKPGDIFPVKASIRLRETGN
jgi:hypothetical protein